MTANLKTPQERFDHLTAVVGDLETGFSTNFTESDKKKHANAEEYFLSTYSGIVDVLRLIEGEKWKDDVDQNLKDDLNKLFTRVLALLPMSVEYVRNSGTRLTRVHKGLLEAMFRLSKRADCTADGLLVHIVKMDSQLGKIRPHPREAWNADASDLNSSAEFEGIFREFGRLEKDPENKQVQHAIYAAGSYHLLQSALRSLHLPEEYAYPEKDIFSKETRPTYVEYPYGSNEFFYGKGSRPGILSVKSKLGSPFTPAQKTDPKGIAHKVTEKVKVEKSNDVKENSSANIKKAAIELIAEERKGQKGKEKTKGGNMKGKNKEKRQKKRSKSDKYRGSKKPRTKWGYAMTSVNAAADVEDILRDSKYTDLRAGDVGRPDSNRLVTPTVEIRKTTLVAYRDDLRYIIDEIYKKRFGTPTNVAKLPQTPGERKAWLDRATREIDWARANVNKLMDTATSPAKAKQLRLAAYKLKLVRSMYTLGLLSGEPAASEQEIGDGLIRRLDDWILYEEAWNVSELITLERKNITQELWDTITAQVNERVNNITRWLDMREELDGEKPARAKKENPKKGGGEDDDEDDEDDDDEDKDDEGKGDEDKGDEDKGDENKEEVRMGVDNEEDEEEIEKAKQKQKKKAAEDKEITNGRIVLRNALHPKLPNAGDYLLDPWEEKRRNEWFRAMALAKLTGRPIPPRTHKAPFDPFAAGGPPGWEKLPLETVWDRVQYMWVLTYWRFFQLRELEP